MTSFQDFYDQLRVYFAYCPGISVINFEQIPAGSNFEEQNSKSIIYLPRVVISTTDYEMCKYEKTLKFLGCYASNILRNDKRKTFCSYRSFGICLLKKQASEL